jgi:hypothetical protein
MVRGFNDAYGLFVGARLARDEASAVLSGTEVPVSRASFAPTGPLLYRYIPFTRNNKPL